MKTELVFWLCEAINTNAISSHYLLMGKGQFNVLLVLHIKSVPVNLSPPGLQPARRSSLWRQQPFPQNTVCIPETLSNPCKQHSCFRKQKPQKTIISLSDPKASPLPSLRLYIPCFLSHANEWRLFSLLVFPTFNWKLWLQTTFNTHIHILHWHSKTLNPQPLQCPLASQKQ